MYLISSNKVVRFIYFSISLDSMENLYKSKEWKSLDEIDRAQLLLVIEGLKRGTIIRGNYTTFMNILKKTGLDYKLTSNKLRLHPVAMVARPRDLAEATHRYLTLPKNPVGTGYHGVTGWLLGYPECCTEEYVKERTPEQAIAMKRKDQTHLGYRFGKELDSKIKSKGTYPDIFDYRPPSFTPCSLECPKATNVLSSWKEAIDTLDPEAGKELVYFNRNDFPERLANIEYLKKENQGRDLEYKLEFLRRSVR